MFQKLIFFHLFFFELDRKMYNKFTPCGSVAHFQSPLLLSTLIRILVFSVTSTIYDQLVWLPTTPPPSLYTTRYTVTPLIRRKPLVSDVVVVLSLLNHLGNPSRNVGPQSKYNVSFWKKGESKQTALFSFNTKENDFRKYFFKSTIACTLIKLFFNRYNLNRLSNQKSYFFFVISFTFFFFLASAFSCKSYYDFHSLLAFPVEKNSPISLINYLTTNLLASRNKKNIKEKARRALQCCPLWILVRRDQISIPFRRK